MKRTTFLRSAVINLSMLALILLGHASVYGQTTNTPDTRKITFGIETSAGAVFSGGASQRPWYRAWYRTLNFDIEANLRIPVGIDQTSLYFGLQGTSFRGISSTVNRNIVIDVPGGIDIVTESNMITSCFTANVGIEQDFGWLKSRSIVGFGVLSGRNLVPSVQDVDYNIFATRLRQQFYRESGSIMYGIKFEQTLSNYDNFFSAGLVLGVRF